MANEKCNGLVFSLPVLSRSLPLNEFWRKSNDTQIYLSYEHCCSEKMNKHDSALISPCHQHLPWPLVNTFHGNIKIRALVCRSRALQSFYTCILLIPREQLTVGHTPMQILGTEYLTGYAMCSKSQLSNLTCRVWPGHLVGPSFPVPGTTLFDPSLTKQGTHHCCILAPYCKNPCKRKATGTTAARNGVGIARPIICFTQYRKATRF